MINKLYWNVFKNCSFPLISMLQYLLGLFRAKPGLLTTLKLGKRCCELWIDGKVAKAILFHSIFVKVSNILSMIVYEKFWQFSKNFPGKWAGTSRLSPPIKSKFCSKSITKVFMLKASWLGQWVISGECKILLNENRLKAKFIYKIKHEVQDKQSSKKLKNCFQQKED